MNPDKDVDDIIQSFSFLKHYSREEEYAILVKTSKYKTYNEKRYERDVSRFNRYISYRLFDDNYPEILDLINKFLNERNKDASFYMNLSKEISVKIMESVDSQMEF
jgi:hypothetical protein